MLKNNEICKQFIIKYGGKVIKDIGDAVFASFTSSNTAVICANNTIVSLENCQNTQNKDIRTKITISTGKMKILVAKHDFDILGEAVSRCFKMSAHTKANTMLLDKATYNKLYSIDDLDINFKSITKKINPFNKMKLYRARPKKLIIV